MSVRLSGQPAHDFSSLFLLLPLYLATDHIFSPVFPVFPPLVTFGIDLCTQVSPNGICVLTAVLRFVLTLIPGCVPGVPTSSPHGAVASFFY
jgi:hypothetical protein